MCVDSTRIFFAYLHMYIYIYHISTCIYTYIYVYTLNIYIFLYLYLYTYIATHRSHEPNFGECLSIYSDKCMNKKGAAKLHL